MKGRRRLALNYEMDNTVRLCSRFYREQVMHPDFMFDFVTGNSQNHAQAKLVACFDSLDLRKDFKIASKAKHAYPVNHEIPSYRIP
jgi:hypothetical protein